MPGTSKKEEGGKGGKPPLTPSNPEEKDEANDSRQKEKNAGTTADGVSRPRKPTLNRQAIQLPAAEEELAAAVPKTEKAPNAAPASGSTPSRPAEPPSAVEEGKNEVPFNIEGATQLVKNIEDDLQTPKMSNYPPPSSEWGNAGEDRRLSGYYAPPPGGASSSSPLLRLYQHIGFDSALRRDSQRNSFSAFGGTAIIPTSRNSESQLSLPATPSSSLIAATKTARGVISDGFPISPTTAPAFLEPKTPRRARQGLTSNDPFLIDKTLLDTIKRGYRWQVIILLGIAQSCFQNSVRIRRLRAVLEKKLLPVLEARKEQTGSILSREACKQLKAFRRLPQELNPLLPTYKFLTDHNEMFADFNSPALMNLIAEKVEVTTYPRGAVVAYSGESSQEVLRFIVAGKVEYTQQVDTQPQTLSPSFFEKKEEEREGDVTESAGKVQKATANPFLHEGLSSSHSPPYSTNSGGKQPTSPGADPGSNQVPGSSSSTRGAPVRIGKGGTSGALHTGGVGDTVGGGAAAAGTGATAQKGKKRKEDISTSLSLDFTSPPPLPFSLPDHVLHTLSPAKRAALYARPTRGNHKLVLRAGDHFGGLFGTSAIFEGSYRVFTSTCVIWSISRSVFEQVFFPYADDNMKAVYVRCFQAHGEAHIARSYPLPTTLLRVSIYRKLRRSLNRYKGDFTPCVFLRGEKLFDQDEAPKYVYCVLEGTMLRRCKGVDGTFASGVSQLLGLNSILRACRFILLGSEGLILTATHRFQCTVSSPYALCYRVTADRFISALLDDPSFYVQLRERLTQQIRLSMRLDPVCLKFAPLLKDFPESSLAAIAQGAEPRVLRRSVPLCEPAHSIKEIFLVVRGSIRDTRVFDRRPTRRLDTPPSAEDENGDHLGDDLAGGGGYFGRGRRASFMNGTNQTGSANRRGVVQFHKSAGTAGGGSAPPSTDVGNLSGGGGAGSRNRGVSPATAPGSVGAGVAVPPGSAGRRGQGNYGGGGGPTSGRRRSLPNAAAANANNAGGGAGVGELEDGGSLDTLDIFMGNRVAEELLAQLPMVTPDEQVELNPPLPLLPDKRFEVTVGGGWEGLLVDKWPSGWEGTCTIEAWALPVLKIRTEFNNFPKPHQSYILNYLRVLQKEALGLPKIVVAKLPPMSSYTLVMDRPAGGLAVGGGNGAGGGGAGSAPASGSGGATSLMSSTLHLDFSGSKKKKGYGSGLPSLARSADPNRSRSNLGGARGSFGEEGVTENSFGHQFPDLGEHPMGAAHATLHRGSRDHRTGGAGEGGAGHGMLTPRNSGNRGSASADLGTHPHKGERRRHSSPQRNGKQKRRGGEDSHEKGHRSSSSLVTPSYERSKGGGRGGRAARVSGSKGNRERSPEEGIKDGLPAVKVKPAIHTYMFTGARKPTERTRSTGSHGAHRSSSSSLPTPVDPYLLAVYNGDFKDGELALNNIERDPVITEDSKALLRHCPDLGRGNPRGSRWPILRHPDQRWFAVVPSYGPLPGTVHNPNILVPAPDFVKNSDLMIRKDKQYRDKLLAETDFFNTSMRSKQEMTGGLKELSESPVSGRESSGSPSLEARHKVRLSPSSAIGTNYNKAMSSSLSTGVPKRVALI